MSTKLEFQLWDPNTKSIVSVPDLSNADEETQIAVMKAWFLDNYEDPAENTPYEAKEGGYMYIWGGPYIAVEVLFDRFDDLVPERVIDKLAEELDDISFEWSGVADSDDYEAYVAQQIVLDSPYHSTFVSSITFVKSLLAGDINPITEVRYSRLLYAHVITLLETYLSDAFINTVMSDEKYIRRLVETDSHFKESKFMMADLFKKYESVRSYVEPYLLNISWHNLKKVTKLYEDTLELIFRKDLGELVGAILFRHDIIHRNGKSKDGKEVPVFKKEDAENLVKIVSDFVEEIDIQISILKGHVVKRD